MTARGRRSATLLAGLLATASLLAAPALSAAAPITQVALAVGSYPDTIATAADGQVYVVTRTGGGSSIGPVTTTGPGVVTGCLVVQSVCYVGGMTAGPGGMWFVSTGPVFNPPESAPPSIGQVVPADTGVQTLFPQPLGFNDLPFGIAADAGGALWVTESQGVIARYDPAGPTFDTYPLADYAAGPTIITLGVDGAMWFIEPVTSQIGRIATTAPEEVGSVTQFSLPRSRVGLSGIAAGPDGAMWFTESRTGALGRIAPDGAVKELSLGIKGAQPRSLVTGPDGALWFTDPGTNAVGRMTLAGTVTEYALPSDVKKNIPNAVPDGITVGGDGALWFTETALNSVGRLDPKAPPAAASTRTVPGSRADVRAKAAARAARRARAQAKARAQARARAQAKKRRSGR